MLRIIIVALESVIFICAFSSAKSTTNLISFLDVSSSSEETEDFSKDFNARYQRMKYIRKLNKFISRHDLVIHGIVKNKNYCMEIILKKSKSLQKL